MNKNEQTNKHFTPNVDELPLTEYFANLPKAVRRPVIISAPKEELITEIALICGKTKMTARRWVYGYAEPCLAEKEKIAALLECNIDSLFPSRKKETSRS
ncbi:MAG: hypothetical protein LUG98_11555 [Tannerellaceae bacterium]|nr:hypothetical protein [Tannerellaceae bacterium]